MLEPGWRGLVRVSLEHASRVRETVDAAENLNCPHMHSRGLEPKRESPGIAVWTRIFLCEMVSRIAFPAA